MREGQCREDDVTDSWRRGRLLPLFTERNGPLAGHRHRRHGQTEALHRPVVHPVPLFTFLQSQIVTASFDSTISAATMSMLRTALAASTRPAAASSSRAFHASAISRKTATEKVSEVAEKVSLQLTSEHRSTTSAPKTETEIVLVGEQVRREGSSGSNREG